MYKEEFTSTMSPDDLRDLRRRTCMTQAELAKSWGVSLSLVASLECGRRRITGRSRGELLRVFAEAVLGRRLSPVQKTAPRLETAIDKAAATCFYRRRSA